MPYGVPDTTHDFVHPESRDRAEAFVRKWWAELRKAYYGAQEHVLAMEARHKAAGIRLATANERTTDARRAKDELLTRYRLASKDPPPEELKALSDDILRAEESEAVAQAGVTNAGAAMTAARQAFNKVTNRLAEASVNGERLRQRKTRARGGDPNEALTANLEEQRQLRAEGKSTQTAGTPLAELEANLLAKLDSILGEHDPFRLGYLAGEVELRTSVIAIPAEHKLPERIVTAPDPMPMMLALFGDAIKQRYVARLRSDHAGDKSLRLSRAEKKARFIKIRARLLDLQHEEAALRIQLAGNAREIAFRPEMDALAMLGAEVIR